jgi:hypothetical protein
MEGDAAPLLAGQMRLEPQTFGVAGHAVAADMIEAPVLARMGRRRERHIAPEQGDRLRGVVRAFRHVLSTRKISALPSSGPDGVGTSPRTTTGWPTSDKPATRQPRTTGRRTRRLPRAIRRLLDWSSGLPIYGGRHLDCSPDETPRGGNPHPAGPAASMRRTTVKPGAAGSSLSRPACRSLTNATIRAPDRPIGAVGPNRQAPVPAAQAVRATVEITTVGWSSDD